MKLSKSRIFNYKNNNFEIPIMMATKGKGVSTILNCFSGSEFHASLRLIASFGHFFQLAKTDMKKKHKFGMLFFLRVVAFYGVSPDGLLAASAKTKLKIQSAVQKGIDLGIVKPYDRHVLTGPCTGEQAIKALNLSSKGIESKRVVLSLEKEKTLVNSLKNSVGYYDRYQCYSNKIYFIVGGKYSAWIDLVEWLVIRGARKIVVAIKKHAMSTTASRRFNLLMARYQNIVIQIVSDSSISSKEDLIQLLTDTTATTPLGGIFFATLGDGKDKIRNIQHALENLPSLRGSKPLFVSVMSGGEDVCAELKASGVCPNAISLSWNPMATDLKFTNLVPSLDKILINVDNISSSTIICTAYNKESIVSKEVYSKMVEELPETIDELDALGDTIAEEPGFAEVFTNSPQFSDTSEGIPVFVVTGFRPDRMKPLYRNLIYPTFEARLPETIDSVEHVATQLVQKLKAIARCSCVSLVGVSWGSVVCVLMAQLLEADNVAVSLTLLESMPGTVQGWAGSLLQYGNVNSKLVSHYFQTDSTVAKELASESGWHGVLPAVLSSNGIRTPDKVAKALNAIRTRLNAVFTVKPFPNKIIAKIKVINRSVNTDKTNSLMDYCVNVPMKVVLDEKDYEKMISGKTLAQLVNDNVLHCHPDAKEISVADFYVRFEVDTIGMTLV